MVQTDQQGLTMQASQIQKGFLKILQSEIQRRKPQLNFDSPKLLIPTSST